MNWFFFQDAVLRPRTALVPALLAATLPIPAHALDGCRVLLCLAGPWQTIPECIPDVREALRRAARGKPWPTCAMAGGGSNTASVNFASPAHCPPQYLDVVKDACGNVISSTCRWTGTVDISTNGQLMMQVWWSSTGDSTSTWYSDAARAMYGPYVDPRYDLDYAAWSAMQPPSGIEPPLCYGSAG